MCPRSDSAGPHFNPGNTRHGTLVGPGHASDMPNLHIPPTGSVEQELVDTAITAGNAGNRIARGVINQDPITVAKTPAR
jgi:Cu-Zn family superoxide dismutase